mmetsp:Transcript_11681/g.27021  ORF Transcript_11681/g.27021 Transcript_11681/m.27021 type:complete len:105 (+) Transcript_11681:214-528(+)
MAYIGSFTFPHLAPSALDPAWFAQVENEESDVLALQEESYEAELMNIRETMPVTRPIGDEGRAEEDDDETRDDDEGEEEEEEDEEDEEEEEEDDESFDEAIAGP